MPGPLMAPRSYAYSGEVDPRTQRVAKGTEPTERSGIGGLLGAINTVAGNLAPILERAAAFKRGYQGYPPMPGFRGTRVAGQSLMKILQDMRTRNDAAEAVARKDREAAEKKQMVLELIKAGKIPTDQGLKMLGLELEGISGDSNTSEPAAAAMVDLGPIPPLASAGLDRGPLSVGTSNTPVPPPSSSVSTEPLNPLFQWPAR